MVHQDCFYSLSVKVQSRPIGLSESGMLYSLMITPRNYSLFRIQAFRIPVYI